VISEPAVTTSDSSENVPSQNHEYREPSEFFLNDSVDLLDPFQTFDFVSPFMDFSYNSPGLALLDGELSVARLSGIPHPTSSAIARPQATLGQGGDKANPAANVWDETASPKSVMESLLNITDTGLSLPEISRSPPVKHSAFVVGEDTRKCLLADLASRLPGVAVGQDRLPSAPVLEKYLNSFMNSFNMHLPIFHIPTFDPASNPSPLVLAMCAIGALLLLDRPNAGILYSLSRKALRYKHQRAELELPSVFWDWSRPCEEEVLPAWSPLWDTQTDLLLTYFGAFCGDPEVVVRTMEEIGSLSCVSTSALGTNIRSPGTGIPFETGGTRSFLLDSEAYNVEKLGRKGVHEKAGSPIHT